MPGFSLKDNWSGFLSHAIVVLWNSLAPDMNVCTIKGKAKKINVSILTIWVRIKYSSVILAQFYIPELCAAACCTNSDLLDNHLIKQNLQKIIHAACSLNCGNHQIIRVNTGKINAISRMVGKLRKINTLGSAVALSEWVKLIRSFIKVYYGRNEVRSV